MTKRKLIPSVWYCKYCYQRQPIDIGPDGSLIICTVCGYGLAPLDEVFAAGSMLTWYEGICDKFYAEAAAYQVKTHKGKAARFLLGDLALGLVPLNAPFTGRRLSKYAESVGLTPKAMNQYRRVAAAWPAARRRHDACWSVHALLASHPDRFDLVKSPPPQGGRWTCADAHGVMDTLHAHPARS
ncbi:DUF6192 family protein [Streptomyces caeruleatus]|uniref:DUF6192 family protein n=1 Tax=Streptomyces caeruleatus TaxID=661399 RepID=UPI000A4C06F9|nr:DUF6192 family protein [Streptomyces caeruleatus]